MKVSIRRGMRVSYSHTAVFCIFRLWFLEHIYPILSILLHGFEQPDYIFRVLINSVRKIKASSTTLGARDQKEIWETSSVNTKKRSRPLLFPLTGKF